MFIKIFKYLITNIEQDKAPAIKIAPVKAPARLLGERKSSGSRLEPAPELEVPKIIQGRRGSVLAAPPPDESARRASLLISEVCKSFKCFLFVLVSIKYAVIS